MEITIDQIKALREESGVGILDCRTALEQSNGDFEKALEVLREKGFAKAEKRTEREASEGIVEVYSHGKGRIGVLVELNCETDFVSKTEKFREFAHEIALQVTAAGAEYVSEEDIDEDILSTIREEALTMIKEEGKPENIWENIIEGKIKKFKDEKVLLNQKYIRNDELTIQDMLNNTIAAMGEKLVIRRIARFELGELSAVEEQEAE
jgi:elongation factor Ts